MEEEEMKEEEEMNEMEEMKVMEEEMKVNWTYTSYISWHLVCWD